MGKRRIGAFDGTRPNPGDDGGDVAGCAVIPADTVFLGIMQERN